MTKFALALSILALAVGERGERADPADAVVLLLPDDDGAYCSGVLVAPNAVLTARHCVSRVARGAFGCRDDGARSAHVGDGGAFLGDVEPRRMRVFVGPRWPSAGDAPAARGARVSHDGAKVVCGHDVAILWLDRSIDAPSASVRAHPASVHDAVRIVGWGVNARGERPSARHARAAFVLRRGPSPPEPHADGLVEGEVEIGEGACDGDSGGAVLDRDGALLGVISRGAGDRTVAHGPDCGGATARAVVMGAPK